MACDSTGKYNCTVKGCQRTFESVRDSNCHIKTHFGKYLFCPACSKRFAGDYDIEHHFESLKGECWRRLWELGMVTASRSVDPGIKECCNMYTQGGFDDFPMADEHFELVAGRERGGV